MDTEFDDEGVDAGPGRARRPRRAKIEILHCDEDVIVVNKPAGVWVDSSPTEELTVVEHLVRGGLWEAARELGCAYPLDAAVSGLLVIGRSDAGRDVLAQQVVSHSLTIVCLVIVRGPVMCEDGRIESRIGKHAHGGRLQIDERGGREAVTTWRLRDRFVGYALLECGTMPASPHQIRLQLEAAGIPLAVDPLYGGATELRLSSFKAGYRPSRKHEERPLLDRVSLHLRAVSFAHPGDGRPLNFDAPMPKDFRAAVHQLERFGRMPK
jgi:23S rRNA-/tRNA-specific pseudouridylate synthase